MSPTGTLRPGAPEAPPPIRVRRWREGKVRPIAGKPSARPAGKPGDFFIVERRICDVAFHATGFRNDQLSWAPRMRFSRHWRNLSGPMWFQNQNKTQSQNQALGRDQTTSRWSAPDPGKRTRREDHALSHRPQMSSGRLFLDRVGRHQSPSPLRRHAQPTTRFPRGRPKAEVSILLGSGTFYFALTIYLREVSRQSEKFLFGQSRKFLLTACTLSGWNGSR